MLQPGHITTAGRSNTPKLPPWHRGVFGIALPLLVAHVLGAWLLHSGAWVYLAPLLDSGSAELDLLVAIFVGGFYCVACYGMVVVAVVVTACYPWKRWWTALAGGLLSIAAGIILGIVIGSLAVLITFLIA